MMGKIVINPNSVCFTLEVATAAGTGVVSETRAGVHRGVAKRHGGGQGRRGIQQIVGTRNPQGDAWQVSAVAENPEGQSRTPPAVSVRAGVGFPREAVAMHLNSGGPDLGDQPRGYRIIQAGHDEILASPDIEGEVLESGDQGLEAAPVIQVVRLDVGNDDCHRTESQEGPVTFVGLAAWTERSPCRWPGCLRVGSGGDCPRGCQGVEQGWPTPNSFRPRLC